MGLGASHDVRHLGDMAPPPSLWLPVFLGVLCRAEPFSDPKNNHNVEIPKTDRVES
jgi:hypothetical protein